MIVYYRKDKNFYNLEFIHLEKYLKADILPETHEIHPFPATRNQLHAPHM